MGQLAFRRGRMGETLAASFLVEHGWEILDRNWRDGPRELDLVVRRGSTLAFVEVKSRMVQADGRGPGEMGEAALAGALEALSWRKRREVERAARAWLGAFRRQIPWRNGGRDGTLGAEGAGPDPERREVAGRRTAHLPVGMPEVRFDVLIVLLRNDGPPRFRHLPDAWRPGWDRS